MQMPDEQGMLSIRDAPGGRDGDEEDPGLQSVPVIDRCFGQWNMVEMELRSPRRHPLHSAGATPATPPRDGRCAMVAMPVP
jgi:hypothetical protein